MKKTKEKKLSKVKNEAHIADAATDAAKVTAELHRQAAEHHKEAAMHHLEAAKHYDAGNHEKGAYNALLAHGHFLIAGQFISDDAKHHAQQLRQTNFHE
jgi:hypothetical protein